MSLRELFEQISERDKVLGESLYAFLEAVAEMDAEAKAEISRRERERDGWERGCWEAEQELAKAKAEIERLRKELAEAKAETQNFRTSRGYWKQQCQDARERHREAEAVVKSLVVDAEDEIGWLTRGMRQHSRLVMGYQFYSSAYKPGSACDWVVGHPGGSATEALRAIQREESG